MEYIEEINARQILDSRGNPTIEVEVLLENGSGWFSFSTRWSIQRET